MKEVNLSLSAAGSHSLSLLVSRSFGDQIGVVVAVIGILKQLNIDLSQASSSTSVIEVTLLTVSLNTVELMIPPSIKSLTLYLW